MLKAFFFKLTRSPYTYIGFLSAAAVALYSLNGRHGGADVYTDLEILLSLESFRRMFVICAAIPFAANFADEWNSKAITCCITRKNAVKYSVSNVVVCFVSAFSAVFFGITVYLLISIMLKQPYDPGHAEGVYSVFFKNGAVLLPHFAMTVIFSLSCGMWAVMGMMITAFFPNRYVAICAPFVFCYALERLTMLFPEEFNLQAVSESATKHSAAFFIPWAIAVFSAISILCGIVFTLVVRRRVQNGLS